MRGFCATVVLLVASATPLLEAAEKPTPFDWSRWRNLPVQHGGRRKPLDTLAAETLRLTSNRSSFTDPETGESLDPTTLYLSMLFDWTGWSNEHKDQLLLLGEWHQQYFHLHKPDKWDYALLLRVDHLELRGKLGLEADQKYVSPFTLNKTLIEDPRTGRQLLFPIWGNRLVKMEDEGKTLSKLEKKALELANHLWTYQNHRMGRGLEILPVQGSQTREWMPIGHLILTDFDDTNDPTGQYREIKKLLQTVWAAYQQHDGEAFNAATDELKTALRAFGTEVGDYPSAFQINLEVAYNHWVPFRFAWVLMLLATVAMLLHFGTRWTAFYFGALAVYTLGLVAMVTGFAMRVIISGRPPVTNMYESVVYVGFGVTVFGLFFEWLYRKQYILTAAAAVSTIALILADTCPTVLDPGVRPLEPVLRSNFWLVTHVMTITLSYAAFALAMGIANIALGYYLVRSSNQAAINALTRFTYKAIQVGVLLLAAGVILGGVWADYSWGRFWGWDPKEVWALVALLGYLSVLHARFAGWVGHRGLAALSVACFSLVVMAWYGVNFVLGAGLHSYGFGGGGQGWVYSAVVLQLLFAGVALHRSRDSVAQTHASQLSPETTEVEKEWPPPFSVERIRPPAYQDATSSDQALPKTSS
jgi:cytochrome c-type biogenesis protein CcsB